MRDHRIMYDWKACETDPCPYSVISLPSRSLGSVGVSSVGAMERVLRRDASCVMDHIRDAMDDERDSAHLYHFSILRKRTRRTAPPRPAGRVVLLQVILVVLTLPFHVCVGSSCDRRRLQHGRQGASGGGGDMAARACRGLNPELRGCSLHSFRCVQWGAYRRRRIRATPRQVHMSSCSHPFLC